MIKRSLLLLGTAVILACADPAAPALPAGDIAIVAGAVAQGSAGFAPNPLVRTMVTGGTGVTWVNGDFGTVHRLISDEGLFDSGSVPPSQAFHFTFPGAGTYHYHCLNHAMMVGVVTIAP